MNENFLDLLADNTEIVIDQLLKNEIVKEIPILGSSINLIKGFNSVRDRAYLNKVKLFIENIGQIDFVKKQRIISESKKSEKKRAKFGDAIFTTIEQSESIAKIEYVAVAFEAFLNEDFEEYDLRLICHIIRNSFSDELIDIVENERPKSDLKYLVPTGLAEAIYEPLTYNGNAEPKYKLSSSAEQLRKSWRLYKK